MKNTILRFLLFLFTIIACQLKAQEISTHTIYFEKNSYSISPIELSKLDSFISRLDIDYITKIEIAGHSDSVGTKTYNNTISEKRSNEALHFFSRYPLNSKTINSQYYGESNPISTTDNAINRRVEIKIYTAKVFHDTNIITPVKKELIIGNIFDKLKKEAQVFTYNSSENIVIKGKEGTTIYIPANSLVDKKGTIVSGAVTFTLEEYYEKSDMIKANLNTMSDNDLLETAGMVNISATMDNEKLELKNGKFITLKMAAYDTLKGMQTFIAKEDSTTINWELPTTQHSDTSQRDQLKRKNPGRLKHLFAFLFTDRFARKKTQNIITYQVDSTYLNRKTIFNNIILRSTSLGFINCDRFVENINKTIVSIQYDESYKPVVKFVFKRINSIMDGMRYSDDMTTFYNVPTGYWVDIIAFSLVNDEPYYYSKSVLITDDLKLNIQLVKTTMSELEENLKKLNN